MRQFFLFTVITLSLVTPMSVWSQNDDQDDRQDQNMIGDIRQKYLSESKSVMIIRGDRQVSAGREIKSDVLVINGDLVVSGTIIGKVVVSNGNLTLREGGKITSDAVTVNGSIKTENSDQILGSILQVKSSGFGKSTEMAELPDAAEPVATSNPEPMAAKEGDSGVRVFSNGNGNKNASTRNFVEVPDEDFEAPMPAMPAMPPMKAVPPMKPFKSKNIKGMTDADWDKFNREMEKFNEKMEAFNRKMENMNMDNTEPSDYRYNYNYNGTDSDDEDMSDEDRIDREHSASFVRVGNTPKRGRSDVENGDNYYSRSTYFKRNSERFKNSSFFLFDYNRVDGLVLGAKVDRDHEIYSNKPFQIYGEAGYAFAQKHFNFQLGLDKVWGNEFRFTAGGEVHDFTNTSDQALVGPIENAVSAILLKVDNRDYFKAQGYSFQLQQNLNPQFKLSLAYKVDTYNSLANSVNWALFRSKHVDFRTNPIVDEGTMRSVVFRAELNTSSFVNMNKKYSKRTGWDFSAEAERSRDEWNSDYDFSRYVFNIARYQPLSRWENLDMRLTAGSATGTVPIQKQFYLGGVSTLRGFDFKEFAGNQMALANVEYRISSGVFKNDQIFPVHPFSAILFADAGYAWKNQIYSIKDLAKGTRLNDLRSDVGVGLGDEKDLFRFDIAKSITEKNSDYKFSFRVNYIF